MDLQETIDCRVHSRRQILFSREDPCFASLQQLIDSCPRKVVSFWALTLAEETVLLLEEKCPEDQRARQALSLAWQWARGETKMPVARQAILACHVAAKETSDPELMAHFHAVGQACSTIHTSRHAIGYPIYDLTALLRREGTENCRSLVENRISHYHQTLLELLDNPAQLPDKWAGFILHSQP